MKSKKAASDKGSRVNQTGEALLKGSEDISDIDRRRMKRINEIYQVVEDRGVDQIASVAIDVDLINCENNNRIDIDRKWDEFQTLKMSIEKDGLINSPLVYIDENRQNIICIAGHLRLAALRDLGIGAVNCKYIHRPDQIKRQRLQLLENIARKDIHPIELADTFAKMETLGLSPDEISEQSSIHLQTVRNYLNFGRWSVSVKETIHKNMEKFSKKSKGLQKLGWRAKKNSFSNEEIISELESMISGTNSTPSRSGGTYIKKVEKAKSIFEKHDFSASEISVISVFLKQYDGVDL